MICALSSNWLWTTLETPKPVPAKHAIRARIIPTIAPPPRALATTKTVDSMMGAAHSRTLVSQTVMLPSGRVVFPVESKEQKAVEQSEEAEDPESEVLVTSTAKISVELSLVEEMVKDLRAHTRGRAIQPMEGSQSR